MFCFREEVNTSQIEQRGSGEQDRGLEEDTSGSKYLPAVEKLGKEERKTNVLQLSWFTRQRTHWLMGLMMSWEIVELLGP